MSVVAKDVIDMPINITAPQSAYPSRPSATTTMIFPIPNCVT